MLKTSKAAVEGIGMTSQRTRNRLIERLKEKGISNETVLEVMRTTPRHLFLDEALSHRAYEDSSLPIGHGVTISQPYIVARMTELLLSAGIPDKVLEVGTGSGYQAAVLSHLVKQVYSVERVAALTDQARVRFSQLDYNNISLKHTDGSWGWEEYAQYPAIIVTAAPAEVPAALLAQLADGGVLVIPVGSQESNQSLLIIKRQGDEFIRNKHEDVFFVPMLDGAKR
ncbi:MAG: protein-L-isoaspartate(D-aspartate) O-methyltransferase [Gammaproteobacteria bacterium]|nr:protein-L-isoaspartate(D-aspartate) O-methyltransferase [Gammaproteobacteria bacterium]